MTPMAVIDTGGASDTFTTSLLRCELLLHMCPPEYTCIGRPPPRIDVAPKDQKQLDKLLCGRGLPEDRYTPWR